MTQLTVDDLVDRYVKLRDMKAAINLEAKAKVDVIDTGMDRIEILIMQAFEKSGIDSAKTAAGTAFKTTKTFAGVEDWDAVIDFIRTNNLWHMLKRDVAKAAVEQYKTENEALPPGVSWREEVTIGIRRAAA